MPVMSSEVGGMIASQQVAFGNVANYSEQISPFRRGRGTPYGSSSGNHGGSFASPPASPVFDPYGAGASAASDMISTAGSAARIGVPLAGALIGGRGGGLIDPFTGGLGAMGRTFGWQTGGGWMGFGGDLGANVGRVARGGVGMLGRGLAAGAIGALPGMAVGAALGYATDKVASGARFSQDVGGYLRNQYRFANPASSSGYGFSHGDRLSITDMLQDMGHQDMMTTPQELLGLMKTGSSRGYFRGAEDAKEFRRRFKNMTDSLRDIAKELNTTLTEAMPFFTEARRQGFWTSQDIQGYARNVHSAAYATGMSTGQVADLMGHGAQMARSIGAPGQAGAQMAARAMQVAGAGTLSGVVSGQQLADAGFGTGAQGRQNLASFLAAGTARFARSRLGRWAMASMMNKEGTGLDPTRLSELASGNMSIGRMRRLAQRNVGGEGGINRRAYDFALNEDDMRGQLMAQGPMAQLGAIKSVLGDRLHDTSSRGRLVTERVIRRLFGGTRRQARMRADLARELPRMMEVHTARTEAMLDAQARTMDTQINRSWEGWKRQANRWMDENLSGPLEQAGATMRSQIGAFFERTANRFWGRGGGWATSVGAGAVRDLAASTMYGGEVMGFGAGTGGWSRSRSLGDASQEVMGALGISGTDGAYTEDAYQLAQTRLRAMGGHVGAAEAREMGYGGHKDFERDLRGDVGRELGDFMGSETAIRMRMGAGKLSGADNIRMARAYARAIRKGAGGAALQRAMWGGSVDQAGRRLMGLRAAGGGGAFTDIKAPSTEGGMLGPGSTADEIESAFERGTGALSGFMRGGQRESLGGGSIFERNRFVFGPKAQGVNEQNQVQSAWWNAWGNITTVGGITKSMGGDYDAPVTQDSVKELVGDVNGGRAFSLYAAARRARAQGDDGKAEQYISQARQILLSISKAPGTSEETRSAAMILVQRGGKGRAGDLAADIGDANDAKNNLAATATIQGRMERLQRSLGAGRLGEIGAAGDVGRHVESLITAQSASDPRTRAAALKRLAGMAMENPEEAARVRAMLGAEAGDVGLVLGGGLAAAGSIEKGAVSEERADSAQHYSRRAVKGVSAVMRARGMSLSSSDIRALVRGEDTVGAKRIGSIRRQMMSDLQAQGVRSKERRRQLADRMIKETESGVHKAQMIEAISSTAAGAGIRTLHKDVSKGLGFSDEFRKKLGGAVTGREDPMEQIGKTQIMLLQEIAVGVGRKNVVAPQPKNAKETP